MEKAIMSMSLVEDAVSEANTAMAEAEVSPAVLELGTRLYNLTWVLSAELEYPGTYSSVEDMLMRVNELCAAR